MFQYVNISDFLLTIFLSTGQHKAGTKRFKRASWGREGQVRLFVLAFSFRSSFSHSPFLPLFRITSKLSTTQVAPTSFGRYTKVW